MSSPKSFFDLAPEGRRGPWLYLGGALLTLVLYAVISGAAMSALFLPSLYPALVLLKEKKSWIDLTPDQDMLALIACTAILVSVIALLAANLIVARFLHKQPLITLLTARPSFDMRRFTLSGLTILAIEGLVLLVGYGMSPDEFEVVFDFDRMWPFIIVVVLLTPFQALAEEVFFRGYLTQGISALTGRLGFRLIVPAVIFMLFHAFNSDWSAGGVWAALTYLTLALYLAILTLKSNGLEMSTGMHAFHNMFVFLIATSTSSGMPFATVVVTSGEQSDYMMSYFSLFPVMALHYGITRHLGLFERDKAAAWPA
ncbi:MAG: CPBP family intramembrane metalloprotease [Alphaproteobacteria bacterium]|nr:MAG: CPBP family intramembrane metalloprotease [Alphaproteobacteria bacterium]